MKTNDIIEGKSSESSFNSSDNAANYETLIIHGAKYKTLLTTKYKNRKKWAPVNDKHEKSFIPGTILKLFVKDGELITKGQPLLILEAMKMENTFYAPYDGKVKKVHVKVGEVLPKGTLLVEYE